MASPKLKMYPGLQNNHLGIQCVRKTQNIIPSLHSMPNFTTNEFILLKVIIYGVKGGNEGH